MLLNVVSRFYQWERPGRGWDIWDYDVALEPPYVPWCVPNNCTGIDDGRRPAGDWVQRLLGSPTLPDPSPPITPIPTATAAPIQADLVEVGVALPADAPIEWDLLGQFLMSLGHLGEPLAFEIVGTSQLVRAQFVCRSPDSAKLTAQLEAHVPDATFRHRTGWLDNIWSVGQNERAVVDFGLEREFVLPISRRQSRDVDPLAPIIAELGQLRDDEVSVLQLLFNKATSPWTQDAQQAVGDLAELGLVDDAFRRAAHEKLSQPLFAVVLRVAAKARSAKRTWDNIQSLGAALGFSANPEGNSLAPLESYNYSADEHAQDVAHRRSRRTGMLLALDELLAFVHPPSGAIQEARLERQVARSKAAPPLSNGPGIRLGTNEHRGNSKTVFLSDRQRLKHAYLIGTSGTGKSTLMLNMFLQDMEAGAGCALIDPHGDLVEHVLERIPPNRVDDVVLLDASDEKFPVGLNVLQARSDSEKNLLSSDLVEAFRRLSSTWGDQMTSVLGNAILAFLESSRGGTLADLRRFLVEPDYRDEFLQSVKDPHVVYYWRKEFSLLTGRPQAPLLTRLDTFLRPKLVRAMVGQKYDRLDFRGMMDRKKIFLAKLTQGAIGEEIRRLISRKIIKAVVLPQANPKKRTHRRIRIPESEVARFVRIHSNA